MGKMVGIGRQAQAQAQAQGEEGGRGASIRGQRVGICPLAPCYCFGGHKFREQSPIINSWKIRKNYNFLSRESNYWGWSYIQSHLGFV